MPKLNFVGDIMDELTQNQIKALQCLGVHVMRFDNGQHIDCSTNEVIDSDVIFDHYHSLAPGYYSLVEYTCGGSVVSPSGKTLGTQAPQHLKDKFQCRVGRRAPHCRSYHPNKCAKYGAEPLNKTTLRINVEQLIPVLSR